MGKVESLSSDVNFIKEFEELKLKQRLLIDSLKKKSQSEQERLFLEINAKLDFLVQIFKEANSSDDEKEKVDFEAKFNDVLDKIDSLSIKVDDSFTKVEKLQDKIVSDKSSNKPVLKAQLLEKDKVSDSPPLVSKTSLGDKSKPVENSSSGALPPPPAFKTEIAAKFGEVLKEDGVTKKKKWF
ncbi:MAG: hypothetical protein PF569_09720 [Candidatus Woesearchaeota archaeon]|jgi:hypothetical protein|nr:hypothetical protein [Candidatus Woesearchaeota archaeon]